MNKINIVFVIIFLTTATYSCKKYVDTPLPQNELVSQLAFTDDKVATASVTGIYSNMNAYNYFFANVIVNFTTAMQADDMYYYTSYEAFDAYKKDDLLPSSQYVNSNWSSLYNYIYQANSCIEGISAATQLTPSVKDQLLGESYFIRAFCYFYLVNFYGKVPLVTTTDYTVNNTKGQEDASVVYDTIINDLKQAVNLMGDAYPTGNRVRPNKAAATALLARTYLYTQQWALAETEASKVISNPMYTLMPDLNGVFLANSAEAIWQLEPVNYGGGRNTWEGFVAVPGTPTGGAVFRLDTATLIPSFDKDADLRYQDWVGVRVSATTGAVHYFPYKYKFRFAAGADITEYSMVMRLAEQFLIRAEARIQQDKLEEGAADIDSIRVRAGLLPLTERSDKAALLLEVEQQRRLELFTEWGHRWLDLKRTHRADAVLGIRPEKDWQSTDTLYPIPLNAISRNVNLVQNAGYEK